MSAGGGESSTDGERWTDRLRLIRTAGADDYRASRFAQKLALVATLAWLAYEWGPGNEAVTPMIGAMVLSRSHAAAAVVATSLVTGVFTALQQLASGGTAAYAATTFPRLAETIYHQFNTDEKGQASRRPWVELPTGQRFLYAFSLGSSYAVFREAAVTRDVSFWRLVRVSARSAIISAVLVGVLGAAMGLLKWWADGTVAQPYVDVVLAVVGNPLVWIGILLVYVLVLWARSRFRRLKATPER